MSADNAIRAPTALIGCTDCCQVTNPCGCGAFDARTAHIDVWVAVAFKAATQLYVAVPGLRWLASTKLWRHRWRSAGDDEHCTTIVAMDNETGPIQPG